MDTCNKGVYILCFLCLTKVYAKIVMNSTVKKKKRTAILAEGGRLDGGRFAEDIEIEIIVFLLLVIERCTLLTLCHKTGHLLS